MRSFASVCCILGALAWAGVTPATAQEPKWSAWSEFGGAYKTDDASRGSVTLFVPMMQGPRDLLFVDARGKLFEDSAKEGNLALAYRQMLKSGWNVGAWVGGDVRGTALDNTFWQLSGGLEALSENFDLRVNGYGPVSAPQAAGPNSDFTQVVLSGSSIYMVGGREVGLRGVDGEVGVRLPTGMLSLDPEKFELRAYGGGFYFDHEEALKQVAGPKARLELRVNDILPGMPGSRLTAEYAYSYDEVRDHRHEIGARLRIPLGAPEVWTRYAGLNAQERRMMDGLERDVDIVVVQSKAEPVEDALTNVDFDRVAYANPGDDINATAVSAGANTLLITNGGTFTDEHFIQDSQTWQSGASTIQVRGLHSGTVASFTAPFTQTTLTNSAENVVNMMSNTHINGFVINKTGGSSDDAVVARDDFSNFAITNNTVTSSGRYSNAIGIDDGNDTVWVLGNTLTTTGRDAQGVEFGDGNSNVEIANNTIVTQRNGAGGIEVHDRNRNFLVTDNSVTTNGNFADGITFDNRNRNIEVSGNTVTTNGDDAGSITFNRRNRNIVVSDNTITAAGDGSLGIGFNRRNRGIEVSGNTVTMEGEYSDAVVFNLGNRNITVSGNTLTTTEDNSFGIVVNARNRNVTVSDNTVATQGEVSDAVYFGYRNSNFVVASNTISTESYNSFGVNIEDTNSGGTVTGNTITTLGPLAPGVFVGFENTDIGISGNTIQTEGPFSAGIALIDSNSGITVSENAITTLGAFSRGVSLFVNNDDVTISGNDIETSGFFSAGIGLDFLNDDVTISSNTVVTHDDFAPAVYLGFGNDGAAITGNRLTTSGFASDGILLFAGNTATISSNVFAGSIGDDVLGMLGPGNAVSGIGNTIETGTTIGGSVCEAPAFAGSVVIEGVTYMTSCP